MPSITSWTRLEPGTRDTPQSETLKARIYDPLWMLGRQWQLGEMQGEDNGTPVSARLRGECAQLTRYQPASAAKSTTIDPRQLPLEALVEREAVHPAPGALERLRVSTEAGQQFLRFLARAPSIAAQPLGTKYHAAFTAAFPLPGRGSAVAATVEPEAWSYLEVMSGRVPDGTTLYAALKKPQLPQALNLDPADLPAIHEAADAFIRWYDGLFSEPASAVEDAWSPQRLEYSFSVAAPTAPETVLTSQYSEGELDWYDFDAKPGSSLGAAADRVAGSNPVSIARTVIPAPVTYRGMPASRWWEFEDASVDFGSVDAEPDDLARMLLVEFAITYGNDWFVIPIDIPVGSVCQIQSIVLTDTFGVRTLIPPIAAATHPTAAAWSMFRNTSGAGDLFLAPTLQRKIEGKPLDDVVFLRDEMANMAWGVERIAEGISGRPLNRREEDLARQQRSAPPAAAAASADDVLTWKLSTEVPGYWIPLVPVQISAESGAIRFRRGTTLRPDGTHRPQPARSRILHPNAGMLDIFEEEIPREGARVTRSYQYARWLDGKPLLWIGRKKTIGRGEGSSGLRFDLAE
jgi:hypothetical protein